VSPKALRKFSEGVRLNVLHIPKEYLDFFSREKGRIFSVFGILCLFSSAAVCRNTLIISEQELQLCLPKSSKWYFFGFGW